MWSPPCPNFKATVHSSKLILSRRKRTIAKSVSYTWCLHCTRNWFSFGITSLLHFILTTPLGSQFCYYPHFTIKTDLLMGKTVVQGDRAMTGALAVLLWNHALRHHSVLAWRSYSCFMPDGWPSGLAIHRAQEFGNFSEYWSLGPKWAYEVHCQPTLESISPSKNSECCVPLECPSWGTGQLNALNIRTSFRSC